MNGEYSHIQFTVPGEMLEGDQKESLVDFFSKVLSWNKVFDAPDTLGFSGFRRGQYFVLKGGEPTSFQNEDHFGIAVSSREDFDEIYRRAKEFQSRESRLEVTEPDSMTNDYGAMDWFFLRFSLPVMMEIQYHHPGAEFPGPPV